MTGTEFTDALLANGWNITETATGMRCTDPNGKEFVYNGLHAVRYGTWYDVAKCIDVPLPNIDLSHADLEEAFAESIGPDAYQKLLDEKWLPFQGTTHLRMTKEQALTREVASAREFLDSLKIND